MVCEREGMARNMLILGASYGSLLATKLLMAGHNVTLVCRKKTAELINRDGTEVRIKLRDEAMHRAIFSRNLPGTLDATTPQDIDLSRYDLVALAMQEPQYTNHTIRVLMIKIAEANLPCLSIMNMPPLPYLKRIPALADMDLQEAYTNALVWERFKPGLVSLCSPDPQAFRPPEEAANVLHVGLPTNFKAAAFEDAQHNKMLRELEADIDAVTMDAKAAESLLKPSSAARAVASGAPFIERVDLLVKLVSDQLGAPSAEIDRTVQTVDQKLNEKIVAGGSGSL